MPGPVSSHVCTNNCSETTQRDLLTLNLGEYLKNTNDHQSSPAYVPDFLRVRAHMHLLLISQILCREIDWNGDVYVRCRTAM